MTKVSLGELVGRVLRERRNQLNISQTALARRCGLHRTYVVDVERGVRNIAFKNLIQFAIGLDLEPSELINLIENELRIKQADGTLLADLIGK